MKMMLLITAQAAASALLTDLRIEPHPNVHAL